MLNILFKKIVAQMARNTNDASFYFKPLGCILILMSISFYFFDMYFSNVVAYENIFMSIIMAASGVIIILYDKWFDYFEELSYYIIHAILLFCFPFFFSFMMFQNINIAFWQINIFLGFALLVFLVDWITLIIMSLTGFMLAYFLCFEPNEYYHAYLKLTNIYSSYNMLMFYFILLVAIYNSIREERNFLTRKIADLSSNLEDKVNIRTQYLINDMLAKEEYFNNINHEIRSPLQGFSGIAQGLVEHWKEFSDDRRFEILQNLTLSAKKLVSLVTKMLDLSKYEAGKMLVDFSKFDVALLISDLIEECRNLYVKDKKITFIFDVSNPIFIVADAEKIESVFRNILVNAIKFSPQISSITIKIDTENDNYIKFSVEDQGVGINENEMKSIFFPFTQGENVKKNGVGLGLSIVKQIINAHGGVIYAKNSIDHGGAIFEFSLPKIISSEYDISTNNKSNTSAANILIIDDEEACLTSIELLLFGTHYNLIKMNFANEALNYLQENGAKVNLILLDLMMNDMYGLNFLSFIKNNENLKNIPVILQTGVADSSEIDKAFALGVVGCIKKPYQKHIVLSEIEKQLRQSKKT